MWETFFVRARTGGGVGAGPTVTGCHGLYSRTVFLLLIHMSYLSPQSSSFFRFQNLRRHHQPPFFFPQGVGYWRCALSCCSVVVIWACILEPSGGPIELTEGTSSLTKVLLRGIGVGAKRMAVGVYSVARVLDRLRD